MRQRSWRPRPILIGVFACAAAACGSPGPPGDVKGGDGDLRVLLPSEPQSLNPDLRVDDAAYFVAQNLFSKLVTLDADYQVIPDLADTWEVSADGLTYTFHLADGVRWHDGRPLSAAEVKAHFDAIPPSESGGGLIAARLSEVDAPDARTVRLVLRERWSPFLSLMAWYGTFVLPPGAQKAELGREGTPVVGTGPFRFVTWNAGDSIALEANTSYFRMGPYVDRVVYRFESDPGRVSARLRDRAADVAISRPLVADLPALARTPGLRVATFPGPNRYYTVFNLRRHPFDDARVRRAINMAIDRTVLTDRTLLGLGSPGLGFYTPAVPWAYNAAATVPAPDRPGAVALLDRARVGRRGATRLTADLVYQDQSPFGEIARELTRQLDAVGIAMRPVAVPIAAARARIHEAHDFDLALLAGSQGPDPDALRARFGSKGHLQPGGYANADLDAALAEGAREADYGRRARAYFRAQEILASDLPLAPLVDAAQVLVYADTLTGLAQVEARGLVTFHNHSLVRVRR